MKRVLILLAPLLTCGTGMANDHTENRQSIHDQLQMDRQRFRALQTPELLQRQWLAGVENQTFLDAQASQLRQSMQSGEYPADIALVFVSSLMLPDELKQRVKDVAELNIPVAIRGMVSGDTRATASAVASLVKESNTGDVQIDPITPCKHNTTTVPVLVVACGNQGDTVDRFQGDPILHRAPKRAAKVGDCVDTARDLLCGEVQ